LKQPTCYIAGKITGERDYKTKFRLAAETLERAGYAVMNPATMPEHGFSWAQYMNVALAMLNQCESVCFFEDWTDSPGAKIEHALALASGKRIFYFQEWLEEQNNGNSEYRL
jgi:hypothetical protein